MGTLHRILLYLPVSFIISALTSALTYHVEVLFVTYGIMFGAAKSFAFVGGASIIYFYFEDKKGLATGKGFFVFVNTIAFAQVTRRQ